MKNLLQRGGSFFIGALLPVLLHAQTAPQLGKNSVEEVVAAMTLEEKISMVVGCGMYLPGMQIPGLGVAEPTEGHKRVPGAAGATRAIPRLGIPALVTCDGPSGVHAFNTGRSRIYYATAWPTGTALASSWDTALARRVGMAYGKEAKEYGIDVILGPGMNIHRNPLGARNFEYYSEDPVVTGWMASSMVQGIQSQGIGTSIKHFMANNQETNRNTVNTIVSERALREIYLRPWEITVKKSNPWTIMSSYNLLNGTMTSERHDLLTKILREEWGYKGLVMTDWFGGRDAVAQQKAGNHLLMPGTPQQSKALADAVKNGTLNEQVLNQNVTVLLQLVLKSPAFNKYSYSDQPDLKASALVARQAAAESMVLLKNANNTLPLSAPGTQVALFGNHGYQLITGGTGSGNVNKLYSVPLHEGLFHAGYPLHSGLQMTYTDYLKAEQAKRPPKNIMMEMMDPTKPIPELTLDAALIKKASMESAVAVIGIGRIAGEGKDRVIENDYQLSTTEMNLLRDVSQAFRSQGKRVVVVLNIGGVIDVSPWRDLADAIVLSWQPGQEGGHAITDILKGAVNPSGKLSTTFPASYADEITAKNFPGVEFKDRPLPGMFGVPSFESEVRYEEGIYVGYRYYETFKVKPAYAFGHGLSYTSFSYSPAKNSATTFSDPLQVSITVTNTGKVAGKEVVQCYVKAPGKTMDKPALELRGFAKTKLLAPGESETITFTLTAQDLASYDTKAAAWNVEAGNYEVLIGAASDDIRQKTSFNVTKAMTAGKVQTALAPPAGLNELKPAVKRP